MDVSQTDRVPQHEIKYVQGKQEQEIKHEMHKMEKKSTGSSVKILNTMQRKTKATDKTRNGHNAEFTGKSAKKYNAFGKSLCT